MSRRIKEFVDIGDQVSLDDLIQKLAEVRDSLPEGSEAELQAARRRNLRTPHHHYLLARANRRGSRAREALRRAVARSQGEGARAPSGRARRGLLRGARQARKAAHRRLSGVELQRQAIDAVAKARRLRPVVEDVAEVSPAARAQHLRAEE